MIFLTKVGEGGGQKHVVKNRLLEFGYVKKQGNKKDFRLLGPGLTR